MSKIGDRGPRNGPAYRSYEIRTNGPRTVRLGWIRCSLESAIYDVPHESLSISCSRRPMRRGSVRDFRYRARCTGCRTASNSRLERRARGVTESTPPPHSVPWLGPPFADHSSRFGTNGTEAHSTGPDRRFWALAVRIGKPKAITATARTIAILVYRTLQGTLTYQDPGAPTYNTRQRHRLLRRLRTQAETLGFTLLWGDGRASGGL